MNKRGFTLAEMLAVIAVLGILVLIVLPNVLKNYREAKKIALIDEAKTVYTKATDQYVLERTKGNKIGLISSDGANKLDLQNSDNLEYYIRINNEGQVLQFRLSNGEYCIVGVGDFLPNYTKEDVIDLSDEKQAELCAVTTLVDNATYELKLQVNQPKEKEHDPRTIYLKYNAGWYKNKSLKTELDTKNGQYKIDAPYRANNYYKGTFVTKSEELKIRAINCDGTLNVGNDGGGIFTGREEAPRVEGFAEFEPKYYTIKYKPNGGTGSINNLKVFYGQTKKLDKNKDANGYGINIKRTGYQFLGWKFNNTDYADEAELPHLTDEIEDDYPLFKYDSESVCKNNLDPSNTNIKEFAAQWQKIEYEIEYDFNGGQGNGTYPSTAKYDELVTIPVPKRVGWTFTGWTIEGYDSSTARTGTVADVNSLNTPIGASDKPKTKYYKNLTPLNGNKVKFKATWSQNAAYIYYSAQNNDSTPLTTIKNKIIVPRDQHYPDGTLYATAGSEYNFELRDATINVGGTNRAFKNIIYYNSPNNQTMRQVKYVALSGSMLSNHGSGLAALHNCNSFICLEKKYHSYPAGNEWKCAIPGTCKYDTYDHAITTYTDSDFCNTDETNCSIVLEPNWVHATYKITLQNNSATNAGSTEIYEKAYEGYYLDSAASEGKKMTTSANKITVPTKAGHSFQGYYTENNGGGTQYINANGYITNNADNLHFDAAGTLYAKWKQESTFAFSYSGPFKYKDGSANWITASNSSIAINSNNWYVKLLDDGELTVNNLSSNVDVFLVGGGGGGSGSHRWDPYGFCNGGGGGAGGYTKTVKNITFDNGKYAVTVGDGGKGGPACKNCSEPSTAHATAGGASFIKLNNTVYKDLSAGGGGGGTRGGAAFASGGNGGSGGGTGASLDKYPAANGGTDGGNASWRDTKKLHGKGQGTTTREFGESSGTLYSGGGAGGGNYRNDFQEYGDDGKPGDSTAGKAGQDGQTNTGGGGGGERCYSEKSYGGNGGSGIIIIRNKR